MTGNFCTNCSFSKLILNFATYNDNSYKVALKFKTIFEINPAEIEVNDTVKFLHGCKSWPWPLPPLYPEAAKKRSETCVLVDIATEILQRLCVDVTLEGRYRQSLTSHPSFVTGVECEDIGIGSVTTWHGSPDGRVRGGASFVWGEKDADEDEDESDDDSVHSDGRTTTLEAKFSIRWSHLAQVVGTCVVASFTERNLHPEKRALVPTILIGDKYFRVCLYDCEKDILIISSRKSLSTKEHLSQSAMVLLWAVLNHR